MSWLSPLVELGLRVLPPRSAFQLRHERLRRWRSFDTEFFLLPHLVDPTRAAVDVGAHHGHYAAEMLRFTSRVHCFEPLPFLADTLRRHLPPAIAVHEKALSDRPGSARIRVPRNVAGDLLGRSTIEPTNQLVDVASFQEIEVPLDTLDQALAEPIGFIKIDVEGHEFTVLQGAVETIQRDRPILLIESERRHQAAAPRNVMEFLRNYNYQALVIRNGRLTAVDDFDVAVFQKNFKNKKDYVKDFIFVPVLDEGPATK